MAREIKNIKEFAHKVFYTNVDGKVVACRFEKLVVYLSGYTCKVSNEPAWGTNCFGFAMNLANGGRMTTCHFGFRIPEIYDTIDDCINQANSYKNAYVNELPILEPILADTVDDGKYVSAMTWIRDSKTLTIKCVPMRDVRYDAIEDKLSSPIFERAYKTYEDACQNEPIEVITF